MRSFLRRFVGDRAFYRMILAVAVPIIIQNGVTNFVGLLDNIMIGRLGTESMSGVSIVNQFVFVFSLLIFGAVSAAGIFTAQYHGAGDAQGVRHTFRFKVVVTVASAAVCIAVFCFFRAELISLFLHAGSEEGNLALTLAEGERYLLVSLFGLVPFALTQAYASTLRETGCTVPPMIAGLVAVVCNFVLNLQLIFGLMGFPRMGVAGAALATVIARAAELGTLVVWTHTHTARCPWAVGSFRSLGIPGRLFGRIIVKGLPLMLNELFWSLAITLRNQCYATRGLDAVAAQNIASVIYNLFSIVFL
ncbi:MAG: polysaccharide biosynthesis C-terminal domain-containing protein, partial [Clostridia bacterium]|nr:polysaccharide biosynthesis C-terminal domain-containing protein [Clostridia bacterium]